jgi:hypothetical protein
MSILFGLVALVWVLAAAVLLRNVRALRDLPPRADPEGLPSRVSVVIAARDEEARIETTVRRLLAQEGVELQVIAVDDRSSDRTGAILRTVAAQEPRLQMLRVDTLPEGWLGKCNACHMGAQAATGDWLLFTDADIWMKSDVVARGVSAAVAAGVDHVCLLFGLARGTLLGKSCYLATMMSLAKGARRVVVGGPLGYMGIGAFNLVRTDAYREVGGHVPLRLTVCDDWLLGLLLRRAGRSTRAFLAATDLEADWFATPLGMVKALEKNSFATLQYRVLPVVLAVLVFLSLWTASLVGPWTGTPAGMAAGLAMLLLIVPASAMAARLQLPQRAALLTPLVFPVFPLAMCNSAFRALWQGGIRWRHTFYPLALLRAGNYR